MQGTAPERVANAGAIEHQCEEQPPSVLLTPGQCMSGTSETLKYVG
jgi:hypothetical protein